MARFRIDLLQGSTGAFALLAGLLMLMEPHRLMRLSAFAPLQPYFHLSGALFLVCAVLMIGSMVVRPRRGPWALIHLLMGVALLQITVAYTMSRTWTGAIAFLVLAVAVVIAPWLSDCNSDGSAAPAPDRHLLPWPLGIILIATGLLMLLTPEEFDAPNFARLRLALTPIGLADVLGGIALLVVQVRPVSLPVFRAVHILSGAGMLAYVLLAPLPNRNLVGLAYYTAFWLPLAALPWIRRRAHPSGTTSLAAVLAFALSLAVATPIVAAFAIDAARDDAEARARELEDTQDAAVLISQVVADTITNQQTVAIGVASSVELLSLPPDEVHRRLRLRVVRQPALNALALFRADGTPLGRSDNAPPQSPADHLTFQTVVKTRQVQTGLEQSLALGGQLVISAAPVFDEQGGLIGVAAATAEPTQMLASLSGLQIPGARVFLVDGHGIVVASNTSAAVGTQLASPTVRAALASDRVAGAVIYGSGADEWLTAYQRLPSTGWIVVVERSAAALMADVYAYRDRMLVYLLLTMAAAILGGVVLARRVSAPLIRLAAAVGQFDGQQRLPFPDSSLTEAAQLAAAFDDAHTRLVARTAEREASEAEVRRLNQTLEERVRQRTGELAAASADAQRFRALVASSNDAILSKDLSGTILSWNAGAEHLYGYTAEEIIGRSISVLFPPDHQHELPELLARVARGESVESFDTIRVHRDGRQLDVSVRLSPIRDETGKIVAASAIARDLTAEIERQRRDIGAEKLRALGQMAGGIAHDLNQSLSLITGYGELLEDALIHDSERPLPPHLAEMLRIIRQAAYDGGETVARLLRFARGGSDSPSMAPEPVYISTLLDEVVQLTAPRWRDASQADGRPIRLDVESAPDIVIQGHPAGLREALTNLVFNAADALPQGGQIRLTAHQQHDHVRLTVQDDGLGMPPDVREHIFEPFFTTKGEGGTGLGLAMVQSIVERHRGTITVESTPGQGARFILDFPLAGQPLTPDQPPDDAAPSSQGRLRLLLVDDQKGITAMASMMLTRQGHAVAQASSGEEALSRLEAQPFDLVISDVAMGEGINGWQLAAQIHERWPGLPVVLATGWAAGIDPDEATARGIAGVLHKPYRSADLLTMIASVTASTPAL